MDWELKLSFSVTVLKAAGAWVEGSWVNPETRAEKRGPLLIDTGAGGTAIREGVAAELSLRPTGFYDVVSASGPDQRPTYSVKLHVPFDYQAGVGTAAIQRVYSAPSLADAGDLLGPGTTIGILGRDLLGLGTLVYCGSTGQVSFKLDRRAVDASPFTLRENCL